MSDPDARGGINADRCAAHWPAQKHPTGRPSPPPRYAGHESDPSVSGQLHRPQTRVRPEFPRIIAGQLHQLVGQLSNAGATVSYISLVQDLSVRVKDANGMFVAGPDTDQQTRGFRHTTPPRLSLAVQPRRPCTGALRAKLPTGRAPRSSPARCMSVSGVVTLGAVRHSRWRG